MTGQIARLLQPRGAARPKRVLIACTWGIGGGSEEGVVNAAKALGLTVLALSGCGEADPRTLRPPPLVADRIERLLAGHPCIAPIGQWERHYLYGASAGRYEPPDWGIERGIVYFEFKEAGVDGTRSRRMLDTYFDQSIDDRPIRVASGNYEVATGRLTVDYCGSNHPQTPSEREQFERFLRDLSAH